MQHITTQMLQSAVVAIPEQIFDSHKVIRELMRQNPQAYVRELYSRVDHADPIRDTHAQIGKALNDIHGLRKLDRVDSVNVRSQNSDGTGNQRWERA